MKKERGADPAGDILAHLKLTLEMRTDDLVEIPQSARDHLKMSLIRARWEDACDYGVRSEAEQMITEHFQKEQEQANPE